MCSGTGRSTDTLSDGTLQMLLAVTVQMTSPPGTTLPSGTSLVDFSPLALTTSCSTSAVVFTTMQPAPGACANACAPMLQTKIAARPKNFNPLNMCVSFTSSFLTFN